MHWRRFASQLCRLYQSPRRQMKKTTPKGSYFIIRRLESRAVQMLCRLSCICCRSSSHNCTREEWRGSDWMKNSKVLLQAKVEDTFYSGHAMQDQKVTFKMNATIFRRINAAAAKSLQSCPTLCDPIDGSPSGSPSLGFRILEWVAISFSNAWKWKVKVKSLSRLRLLATPWTAAHQAPPSMRFSRQEYWSGVPVPSPESTLWDIKCTDFFSFLLKSNPCQV